MQHALQTRARVPQRSSESLSGDSEGELLARARRENNVELQSHNRNLSGYLVGK